MLMPEYLRHVHNAGLKRYVETGKRHISWEHVEVPALHRDGHEFPLEISFGDFSKNEQHIFIGIARDVSERRRAESEREQLLQREQEARLQAEEANRIKDDFLATLSHELRTPLNAILGWAQMLQTHNLSESDAEKALATIERNARSQSQLIEDLLDVSRIITGKLRLDVRAVDLTGVITAAVDAVRPAAEAKNIRLQALLDPHAGPISGDPDRLQQVVWNLLSNAVKFTPKGGRVQVRLERINSHVEIVISDTGKGIEPEFLPNVFDRFRQSDGSMTRRHGGLGLGLAIVRQLVELHGGVVSVESAGEGQGSTFTVNLPLLPVRTESRRREDRVHPAARSGALVDCPPELFGLCILLVDDEADSRELLNLVLGSCGAEVTTVGSASEAFRVIQDRKFDVIISDIGMPEEDGFSLISRLRELPAEKGGSIPAVALTAYARAEDRIQALRSGFQMHIAKPVEPSELIAVVANLAGRMGISKP
jgi:signal transduction histidine kinase